VIGSRIVKIHGPLDQAKPQDLRVEIQIVADQKGSRLRDESRKSVSPLSLPSSRSLVQINALGRCLTYRYPRGLALYAYSSLTSGRVEINSLNRHLLVADFIHIGANGDFVSRQSRQTKAQDGQSLQHFFNDVLWAINKFFLCSFS
jgi:hypothetical protein